MSIRTTPVMSVSPDFPPKFISGWYIFNTWLQRVLAQPVHLMLYDSFESQREAILADQIDLIYANPHDAAMLVREKGFTALAAPLQRPDEALIVVSADALATCVTDLRGPLKVVCSDDPEVNLIANIMLEPADIAETQISTRVVDSYVLVAKALLQGKAEVGFFLQDAFSEFTSLVRDGLRVLVRSEIQVVQHVFLAGPRLQDKTAMLTEALLAMADEPRGAGVLASMDLVGWSRQSQEDTEFMIDLMDTLQTR